MARRVSIFGATGSIGQSTIDLIDRDRDGYEVVALTGGRNIRRLAADAIRLRAQVAVTCFDSELDALRDALAGTGIEAAAGTAAVTEAAARPADWVMSAIVGAAGLAPGLAALKQGATLALANKESLVTAGPLIMQTARDNGARILPVDSEHSAIFQGLVGEDPAAVERVVITASGGAFRDWPLDQLAGATVEQASTHPNWNMGQRITIDSATMFNKALEVIEAKEFFGLSGDQIEVVIHPESLIHALVGYHDGAMMAHVGAPDMRHAIGYALHWPDRKPLPVARLNLAQIGTMTFRAPDPARYPALPLAWRVMEQGGAAGAVFNAAKEVALDLFISKRIAFLDMAVLVEKVLDQVSPQMDGANAVLGLESIRDADAMARRVAMEIAERAI